MRQLSKNLIGKTQAKVISTAFDLGDNIVNNMLEQATPIVLNAIKLGNVFAVDEALWAYFGSLARSLGKLRTIPNKPQKWHIMLPHDVSTFLFHTFAHQRCVRARVSASSTHSIASDRTTQTPSGTLGYL